MRAGSSWLGRAVIAAVLAVASPAIGRSAAAGSTSLPTVPSGERPGPSILYEPMPDVPELTNHDPRFRAPFVLVQGAERYVDGEYLYSDYLGDDAGSDTAGTGGGFRATTAGKVTYPTDDARYAGNAADLLELRIARAGSGPDDGLAVRFTLRSMVAADAAIATIAFDADDDEATGNATLPRDPGAPFEGTDDVLTTWGSGAEWSHWTGAGWSTTALASTADLDANQVTVTVPASVARPTGQWTATAAVGLRDTATGGWLRPGPAATATQPGGAGPADPLPSGIFNLAFRFDQEVLHRNTPPDEEQAAALAAHAPTTFAHPIDFDLLAAGGVRDDVPVTGTMLRTFASRIDRGEGTDQVRDTVPFYEVSRNRVQSYALYVPTSYDPSAPSPFTLYLHSLNQHHWQYDGSLGIQQVGEERGSLVVTPGSRSRDGYYQGALEADVFEAWADVAHRYRLDPDHTSIVGYSMGGYGTYRLGGLYPDLFARAATIVGPPSQGIWLPPAQPGKPATLSNTWLEGTRNLPFLNMAAREDELVPYAGPRQQNTGAPDTARGHTSFDALGYRFRFLTFQGEHYTLGLLGYDAPMVRDHLGDHAVDRNPFHVTYARVPATDAADLGLVHDKAYWLSGIELADDAVGTPNAKGVVDVTSLAFGLSDPTSTAGSASGSAPVAYDEVNRTWSEPGLVAAENRLTVTLRNIGAVVVDGPRARLADDEDLVLDVTTDSAATITVKGADGGTREITVPAGTGRFVLAADSAPAVPDGRPALLVLSSLVALAIARRWRLGAARPS